VLEYSMVFQNIAVSGRIAVGASTLAKTLTQKLGWPLRDASQIFRDVTAQMGFNLETDVSQAVENRDDLIDKEVDDKTLAVLKENHHVVVTSKLAGFLSQDISHTFRILIICPQEKRIHRYAASRGYSPDKAKELLILRERLDQQKWERLYGKQDFFAPANFHLVIDSGRLSLEEEVELVLRHLNLTQNLC